MQYVVTRMGRLVVVMLGLGLGVAQAAEDTFSQFIFKVYESTKEKYAGQPADLEAAWRYGRACFEWAEFAKNNSERSALAEEGIGVCRALVSRKPEAAEGYYYLGMNLGQLARTRTLTALSIVSEMEEVFQKARRVDANVDYAGPDRYLGKLYRDAPGWPASIGNRKKAREHLQRAVALRPDYPENHIALLESYQEWGDKDAFLKQFGPSAVAIAEARKKLKGDYWQGRWAGWDQDWHEIRAWKLQIEPKVP